MHSFERLVRAAVIGALRDTSSAPSAAVIAASLGAQISAVSAALHALADEHRRLTESARQFPSSTSSVIMTAVEKPVPLAAYLSAQ